MTARRRLVREMFSLKVDGKHFRPISLDFSSDVLRWTGLLVPENAPYNHGAFRVQFTYPKEYPFVPPMIRFLTKIYHPNIDQNGNVCLGSIVWMPTMQTTDVVDILLNVINNPQPKHALRPELAKEFMSEPEKFVKNAEEYTRMYSAKFPLDAIPE